MAGRLRAFTEARQWRFMNDEIAITITVNGETRTLAVPPDESLLTALRDRLRLTGTKECCGEGECGACTVLLDGRAVDSCIVLAVEADGRSVTTIEGLEKNGRLDPIQEAFLDSGSVQCGFCTPGMLMAARYLLDRNPDPTDEEIKEALCGNLCRCTGYTRIIAAVRQAAAAGRTRPTRPTCSTGPTRPPATPAPERP